MSFTHNTSYVEMEPLAVKPRANVTIVFATTTQNGILFYTGRDQHLAVELFRGRIRVSYDVGNYPVSTMFRQECHLQKVGIKMQYLNHATQLPRYVSMLIKLFQVFYYVFLVVPSLDFML